MPPTAQSAGRRLLTLVRDIMRQDIHVPAVSLGASFVDLMREISAKGLGATAVVDAQHQVLGVFTDGDLRRAIEGGQDLRQRTAQELMRPHPRTIGADALAAEAADLMEQHRISCLFVLDDHGRLCGALNTHDLMRAKVI